MKPGRSEVFWPSPNQELILQTIFLPRERAEAAWREVRPRLDLDVMEEGSYFLMPLLYRRLSELAIADVDLPRLKGIYKRTWYRNQLLTESVQRPLGELRRRGISPVLLLGAASTSRYYSELGLRWLEYFETIVPAVQFPKVAAVLEGCGFSAAFERRPNGLRPLPFLDDGGNVFVVCGAPPLDLLPPGQLAEGISRIRERSTPADFGGETVVTLDPTDELLLVCLTGARPGARPVWVADAMSLLGAAGDSVDWRRLCDQAASSRVGFRVEAALSYLRDAIGAPVPELAFGLLRARPVSRRELVAHKLSIRPHGLLGGFPATVGEYLRLSSEVSVSKAVAGYPRFLQQIWELDHLWQLPWCLTVKAFSTLRRVLRQRQPSALSRGSYPMTSRAASTSQKRQVFAETP